MPFFFLQGVQILFPYINRRVVEIPGDDLVTLLSTENPFLSKFSLQTHTRLGDLNGMYNAVTDPADDFPICIVDISSESTIADISFSIKHFSAIYVYWSFLHVLKYIKASLTSMTN